MIAYWIGVASRDHVLKAVVGGFCQLSHGKEAPIKKLKVGDKLIYYSPKEQTRDGKSVQAFTAIGEILDHGPFQASETDGFRPFRRQVRYLRVHEAAIRPLLSRLSFSRGKAEWGLVLRRGLFQIEPSDYDIIAEAMGAQIANRAPRAPLSSAEQIPNKRAYNEHEPRDIALQQNPAR